MFILKGGIFGGSVYIMMESTRECGPDGCSVKEVTPCVPACCVQPVGDDLDADRLSSVVMY